MTIKELIGAISIALCASTPALAATHTVRLIYNDFLPHHLTIKVGDEVQWVHDTSLDHGVTTINDELRKAVSFVPHGAEQFESGFMMRGDTYKHTFMTPGLYKYVCPIHSDKMFGYIEVVE